MTKKNKVAIYCRLSNEDTEKQGDDSESIRNQRLLLTDYALEQSWDIFRIYIDEDYSGLDSTRPQFNQMLSDAEKGRFQIVLCKTQSRFTRDMVQVEHIIHELFPLWGIRFIALIDHADTQIRGNKKARQINGLMNEWYCEDLSENIRAVFQKKMRCGQFIGSFAPYGYKKSLENHNNIVPDEAAAQVVRDIFSLYLKGHGANTIAKILTERGVAPPSLYKKKSGLAFENPKSNQYSVGYGLWSPNTIRKILRNPVYIGTLAQGKQTKVSYKNKKMLSVPYEKWIVVENNHIPIVDRESFDMVQGLMDAKRNKAFSERQEEIIYKNLFSGKLICKECGNPMQKGASLKKGQDFYYRCGFALRTGLCSGNSVRAYEVYKLVEERIQKVIFKFLEEEQNQILLQNAYQKLQAKKGENNFKKEAYLEALGKMLTEVYKEYSMGKISKKDFLEETKALHQKMDIAVKKQEDIPAASIPFEEILKKLKMPSVDHELLNGFIDKIEVEKKDEKGVQAVTLHWLF